MQRDRLAAAALALALLSLALNAWLVWRIRNPEPLLRPVAERLAERVRRDSITLRYTVRIPAGTPLRFDLPVDERFTVRVDTVIALRTRVRVPLETPWGTRSVQIPIRADIPLRTALPLHVRHTVRLRTRTREQIAVPLEIELSELPIDSVW